MREQGRRASFYRNTRSIEQKNANLTPLFIECPDDNRPYINISVYGRNVVALLDSGASHSFIGKDGLHLVEDFKLKMHRINTTRVVYTADGKSQKVEGCYDIPVFLEGSCQIINFYVVPSLRYAMVLGSNFCNQFRVVIDYRNQMWSLHTDRVEISVIDTSETSRVVPETRILTDAENKLAASVIDQFKEISGSENRLGRTRNLIHQIDTGDAKPFRQRQYLMSPYMLQHLNAELDKMLALDVIEPSHGAWSSPVLLVKKKNGDFRFCFDGRTLNSVTKPDRYPLPRVDRILNMLRDAKFITSIDLRSAFWQIPLSEESKEKTGFCVPGRGMFQFKVMPFGLSCSAQTLQRLMDATFGPELEPNVFCYLDDIIVTSISFDDHLKHLKLVCDRLKKAGLTINFEKCSFFRKSLKYLGFIIDGDGLRTDPDKVSSMVNYPRPRNTTEIKRFVGMCSWYRRFIADFSSLISPLNDLLKGKRKKSSIVWSPEAEAAFIKIKQALVEAPILRTPDFNLPFTIQCDASDTGVGGVLTQEVEGEEVVIAFCSRSLSKAERNYCVTQRELLALLFCIEKFRPYVEGTRFRVITDHYSLLWLNRLKEPTGKLARWAVKLQQYSFDLCHRKGSMNVVPDALSRIPNPDACAAIVVDNLDSWYLKLRNNIHDNPEKFPQYKIEDNRVFKYFPSASPIRSNITEWKALVPVAQRAEIIASCHNPPTSAHFGVRKTLSRIQELYYWPKMRLDVIKFVRSCESCGQQKTSNSPPLGLMGSEKKVKYPWQVLALDIMGPFTRSSQGNSYLLVVADWFSKYTLLLPMKKAVASTIVKFVENQVFLVFGVPQYIICDNGTQFAGKIFKGLADKYKVQKIWFNARYHPQANFVERINRTIGTAIRGYIGENQRVWDKQIHKIQYALNTSKHEVTGYTPSFINFGRITPINGEYYGKLESTENLLLLAHTRDQYVNDIRSISEVYESVRDRLHKAYERNANNYNLRRKDIIFNVGDKVWRKNKVLSDASQGFSAKLAPKYIPCVIRERLSRLIYRLNHINGSDAGTWHVKDLKPYFGSNPDVSVN